MFNNLVRGELFVGLMQHQFIKSHTLDLRRVRTRKTFSVDCAALGEFHNQYQARECIKDGIVLTINTVLKECGKKQRLVYRGVCDSVGKLVFLINNNGQEVEWKDGVDERVDIELDACLIFRVESLGRRKRRPLTLRDEKALKRLLKEPRVRKSTRKKK